ncbi:Serine/threonine-protein kinase H1 [Escovopsis weberi]|uniref:Serine/threonine-protein kinase H1 n=1 Tax=Escovopsis weberi TaxID=150374 RepID=A0A0M8N242_ESCWE|nr:Serine/threonine-protein kinase H1 [Escovopsis weberi]
MWSLGVVTLHVLLSCNEAVEELDSRSQKDIDRSVQSRLRSLTPRTSSDGQNFVSRCLQRMPSHRMTAVEAERHDWFRRPKKYAEFFQKLDQRILDSWVPQSELKPMPLEIGSCLHVPTVVLKVEALDSTAFSNEATGDAQAEEKHKAP